MLTSNSVIYLVNSCRISDSFECYLRRHCCVLALPIKQRSLYEVCDGAMPANKSVSQSTSSIQPSKILTRRHLHSLEPPVLIPASKGSMELDR